MDLQNNRLSSIRVLTKICQFRLNVLSCEKFAYYLGKVHAK